jgi:hypothetical protein
VSLLVIKDDRGQVMILTLVILILLLAILTGITNYAQIVAMSNPNLQNAIKQAVKAATYTAQFDGQGDNRSLVLEPSVAQTAFTTRLAGNLGLSSNLEPLSGSPWVEKLSYILVIYNFRGDYYILSDGTFNDVVILNTGEGIFEIREGGGKVVIQLENSGVIAVVRAKLFKAFGDEYEITRWAAARVYI